MSVFFLADLHIGHAKVAEIRFRPHAAQHLGLPHPAQAIIQWHDDLLALNWDAVVKPDDIVWILGDISAGGRAAQLNALEWIQNRPGKKHLITGNHDACSPIHRDSHKWQRIYLEAFESVQMAARRKIPTAEGNVTVLLSHFPYVGDRGQERYAQWRLRNEGLPLLHGHTHSAGKLSRAGGCYLPVFDGDGFFQKMEVRGGTPQIHVGLDAWDLTPVSLEQIGELL